MGIRGAAVVSAACLMTACGQPVGQSTDAYNQSPAALPEPDAMLGMWSWQSEDVNFTNLVGTWVRRHKGTFLVSPGKSPGQYDISLNFTQNAYVGTKMEEVSSSQQQCVGIKTDSSFAIQCSVDPKTYPNWTPASFSFQLSGTVMSGALLTDGNVGVSATKL